MRSATDRGQFRVAEAIRAYQEGQVDLRTAAERARLPVAVLEDVDAFSPGLEALPEAFREFP